MSSYLYRALGQAHCARQKSVRKEQAPTFLGREDTAGETHTAQSRNSTYSSRWHLQRKARSGGPSAPLTPSCAHHSCGVYSLENTLTNQPPPARSNSRLWYWVVGCSLLFFPFLLPLRPVTLLGMSVTQPCVFRYQHIFQGSPPSEDTLLMRAAKCWQNRA